MLEHRSPHLRPARLDEAAESESPTGGVEQALSALRGDLESLRSLPAQLAEGMAAIRDAVAEMAAAQALVEERLDQAAEDQGERAAEVMSLVTERLTDIRETLVEALDIRLADHLGAFAPAVAEAREATWALEQVAASLHAEVERASGKLSRRARDAAAVEGAAHAALVDAIFERMEQAFDRRFDALVQVVDARMRQALEAAAPADGGRRAGFFRRVVP